MDHDALARTRRSLHGVAELVLAGPQYAASRTIRLRVTPGGFGTVAAPDLRVDGLALAGPALRLPLDGTFGELAVAVGVEARPLREVYADGPGVTIDDPIEVDHHAVTLIADVFARGDAAARILAPGHEPVIWPEHFDIGIALDEVNFGVSPGDAHMPEPYAYVGPWSPREGEFWNTPFGAARPMSELPDVHSVVGFFRDGATRAAADPRKAT